MKGAKSAAVVCSVLASLAIGSDALAVPPHAPQLVLGGNLWTITFFDDTSPIHTQWATQRICFFPAGVQGTHQRYAWVSISYPDWNGLANQEGDQIFMHGDFQWPFGVKDGGHDGMEWQLVTMSPGGQIGSVPKGEVGTGHWKEWIENGGLGINVGWGNTLLRRVGQCPFATFAEAFNRSVQGQLRAARAQALAADSDSGADNPMGIPESIYRANADETNKALEEGDQGGAGTDAKGSTSKR
jgi:hypothetical protein